MIKTLKEYIKLTKLYIRYNNLITNIDGRNHYVYRIKDLTNNTYYYGSRTTNVEDVYTDLLQYGSSSKMKNYILENIKDFEFKIIKIFNNSIDKMIFESFLHQRFNVKSSVVFWNEANQTPFGFDRTGIPHTQEVISKMKINNKGEDNPNFGRKMSMESIIKRTKTWSKVFYLADGSISSIGKESAKKYKVLLDQKKIVNGESKTLRQEISDKVKSIMHSPNKDHNMTNHQANMIKMTQTRTTNILMENGDVSNSFIIGAKKGAITKIDKNKKFNLYHITKGLIKSDITRFEVRKISRPLESKTKINYLGKTKQSASSLKKSDKTHLIGLYVIEV